jgi:23S rRNA (pseudouridine1915-N3)-methyltransferase
MAAKITIVAVGKDKSDALISLNKEYLKRTPWKVDFVEIMPKKILEASLQKAHEAELILKKIPANAVIVALDEKGEMPTSPEFAKMIDISDQEIAFVIGGAHGLDKLILTRAKKVISFGRVTYPHMIARMLLVEQIYRAHTILNNHPYHKI